MNKSLTKKLNRNKQWKWSGGRQRKAREGIGFTLSDFAALIGVSKQRLHQYENDISRPSALIMEKIFLWTGKPPRYFFERGE